VTTTTTPFGILRAAAEAAAAGLQSPEHGSAEVFAHQRVNKRVETRMDVGEQVDDNAEDVHLRRESIQSNFDGDLHGETRAPADQEEDNHQNEHFDNLHNK